MHYKTLSQKNSHKSKMLNQLLNNNNIYNKMSNLKMRIIILKITMMNSQKAKKVLILIDLKFYTVYPKKSWI